MNNFLSLSLVGVFLLQASAAVAATVGRPTSLRVESSKNPLGIDVAKPRFSWFVPDVQRNTFQVAFRLRLVRLPDAKGGRDTLVWDSGKVESDQSVNVAYAGPTLDPLSRYKWTVRTWDNHGNESAESEPQWFETTFLDGKDWKAEWIGDTRTPPPSDEERYGEIPNPLLRKEFTVGKGVSRARLYICGLGYYEAELNGEKVGDHVLDPGWTNYGKRSLYSVYDVSDQLKRGRNALGVSLGNGWYNPLPLRLFGKFNLRDVLTLGEPKLIAELHIWYANGDKEVVKSDRSWSWSEGPILKNNVYLGERYDARREQPGWSRPGFAAKDWKPVRKVDGPGGTLRSQMAPPIRITKELEPVSVTRPSPEAQVFDLGQNFAGWIRLTLEGEAGTTVRLRYGELLGADGRVNGMTAVAGHIKEIWDMRGGPGAPATAYQEDTYVLKGGGEEQFQQKFGFHGFRYVEVVGYEKPLKKESLVGLRLNSDLADAGSFECSNELFNRIQEVVEWTMLSNAFSIQSDCPGREKLGYGGDIITAAEGYIYNYAMDNFYRKTVDDFQDDVRPNGGLPETAPFMGIDTQGFGEGSGPIGWQLAHPYVVRELYRYYGDKLIVEEQYDTAKTALEFLREQAGDDHYIEHGIGDHVSLSKKELPLTSTAFYYHFATLVAEFAEILEKDEDAKRYRDLASAIDSSFAERFVESDTGKVGDQVTQANQLFALYYDLGFADSSTRDKAVQALVDDIDIANDGHLTTGIFSTQFLWDVLDRAGLNDVAYTVADQRDFPGFGHMLERGATTLWETWKEPDQASHNHPMFGSVSAWFYKSILGIQPGEGAVGMDRVLIKPSPVGELTYARGHYDTVRGRVAVDWRKEGEAFFLDVTVPTNCLATIELPVEGFESPHVLEGGKRVFSGGEPVAGSGLALVESDGLKVTFEVGSGVYRFEVAQAVESAVGF